MSISVPKTHLYPLTLAQLDFWEEYSIYHDQPISTIAHYLELKGCIDLNALCKAITTTIAETDVLSLSFCIDKHQQTPLQYYDSSKTPELKFIDLHDTPFPIRTALQLMKSDIEERFDLLHKPLSAQWLIKLGETHFIWYNRAHHIILDGYSVALMEQRCAALYQHFLTENQLDGAFYSFIDYLHEEKSYQHSEQAERDGQFWKNYLQQTTPLPVLVKGDEEYGIDAWHHDIEFHPHFRNKLQQLSLTTQLGWPDLLVALSALYLFYFFHEKKNTSGKKNDLIIWIPFLNRRTSLRVNIPALLVNILPLSINTSENETLVDFLIRIQDELTKLRKHGRYRVEQLAKDNNIPRGSRYYFSPLINVLPFEPPIFKHCQVKRCVLANGPGDGFNLTYRGDMNELFMDIDVDAQTLSKDSFMLHQQQLWDFFNQIVEEKWQSKPIICFIRQLNTQWKIN